MKCRSIFVGLAALVCVACLYSFGSADEQKPPPIAGEKQTVVREDGPVQGMWYQDQRVTMGLVTKKADIPENFQDTIPYVAVWLKDATGKEAKLPFALNLGGGELTLQIPRPDKQNPIIVPMRRVIELIRAAEQIHNEAK